MIFKLKPTIRYAIIVVLPVLVLLALSTAIGWWHLIQSADELRRSTLAAAELRGKQLDQSMTKAVGLLFDNADKTLLELISNYSRGKTSRFEEEVASAIQRFPEGSILQIAVIANDGYLTYSNLNAQSKTYLGDREHFTVHQENKVDQLFISKPTLGKISHKWSIQFSRPIFKNGKVEGVMVMSLSPEYLENVLLNLPLTQNDSLYIVRATGEVMARNRDMDKVVGFKPTGNLPYLQASPGESGIYIRTAQFDGVERLYLWNHLKNFPAVVIVGLSVKELMAPAEEAISAERTQGIIITAVLWLMSIFAIFLTLSIQAHIKKREASEYAASHDALTGLANRKSLEEKLRLLVKKAESKGLKFCVLFIDLDGFKAVNDSYGHAAGDAVLQAVGLRIQGCARSDDLVARLGGDEFVIVCPELQQPRDAQFLVNRIRDVLSSPIRVEKSNYAVGASIGIAFYPDHGKSIVDLIHAADQAMYADKSQSKRKPR